MVQEASVRLFGATSVFQGDRVVTGTQLGGVKIRRILGVLGLCVGHPVDKDLLADRVWEGRPPASYRADLESYVCVLRRKMGLGPG